MDKLKFLLLIISLIIVIAACTNNGDKKEDIKEEVAMDKETIEQQISKEENVIDNDITEENEKVILTIKIKEDTTEEEANIIADKYLNELIGKNKGKQVQVNLNKGKKQILSKSSKQNDSKIKDNTSSEKAGNKNNLKVKSLVAEKKITLKQNAITKQLSVLIDKRVMTELKDNAVVQLRVGNHTYTFEENPFESAILQVNNTDYTEAQLLETEIVIK